MQAKQLEQLLHQEIPITQALQIKVEQLDQHSIKVLAPFDANKNIHNTAFAGSIYTTATLAGWSLLTNFLDEHQLQGSVVLAKGEIKYSKPINGDIVACCKLPENEDLELFRERLQSKGRARLTLIIEVKEDDCVKAQLEGSFAVIN
ncbi:MAG: YiiD C-terminal domain-containing protein [Kangiellaceae bacterium]|nr:YiiD C-terminal domain-containing protein [Kangiellaceae bacterium]